jgi:hypothetical protein
MSLFKNRKGKKDKKNMQNLPVTFDFFENKKLFLVTFEFDPDNDHMIISKINGSRTNKRYPIEVYRNKFHGNYKKELLRVHASEVVKDAIIHG